MPDERIAHFSQTESLKVYEAMGMCCGRMGVNRTDPADIQVFPDPMQARLFKVPYNFEPFPVSRACFDELLALGCISELSEYRDRNRGGWREMELPGDRYQIYALSQ